MHLFPQLRKLEEKYSAELVVIGIHSAKFTAEKSTANVRKAVLRYEIEHPVVNDRDFEVWQRYSVKAWPTLMFIDPEGKVVGKHEGEISADAFDNLIGEMVGYFDQRGLMDRTPLPFRLEREKELERTLSFPGKLLADEDSERLFVADSNHNRLLIASLDGRCWTWWAPARRAWSTGLSPTPSSTTRRGWTLSETPSTSPTRRATPFAR